VLLWGGFNWALELTNTEQFCISCHKGIAHHLPEGWEEAVDNDPLLKVEAPPAAD